MAPPGNDRGNESIDAAISEKRNTSSTKDENATQTAIARHHSISMRKIKVAESSNDSSERALMVGRMGLSVPPESESNVTKQGDYRVRSTPTRVIKVKEDSEASSKQKVMRQRLLQLVAGGGSGAITKTATAPLERVKILLQLQGMKADQEPSKRPEPNSAWTAKPKYKGILGTMRTVIKEEGFLSLYQGNGANVLRVVPVYSLKFMFNDAFRDLVRKDDKPLSFDRLILSGTLAGLFQTCMTYPLETIRTRLTLGTGLGVYYNGILDVIRTTVRTEGVVGLYKGIGPTILTGSPYVGLQMSFYELFKRNLPKEEETSVLLFQIYKLTCGAVAGVIAQTLTYPGDTVRRRMQTNGMNGEPKLYTNSWDCTKKIVKYEGVHALFNGISANLIRALPGAAIQFWAYDTLKGFLNV